MAKIRVNKLALELGLQNDQIIDALKKKEIVVKNHMSSVDEEAAQYIRDLFSPKTPAKAPTKAVKVKAKIKLKTPSKIKITTAKTKAKSEKVKKAEKKEDAPAKKKQGCKNSQIQNHHRQGKDSNRKSKNRQG